MGFSSGPSELIHYIFIDKSFFLFNSSRRTHSYLQHRQTPQMSKCPSFYCSDMVVCKVTVRKVLEIWNHQLEGELNLLAYKKLAHLQFLLSIIMKRKGRGLAGLVAFSMTMSCNRGLHRKFFVELQLPAYRSHKTYLICWFWK